MHVDGRDEGEARWQRLMELLEPVHARAARTARRLAGSAADGEDLFHEAVLRAHASLDALRDAERFPAWFYTVLVSVHRNRTRRSFWKRFIPLDAGTAPGTEPPGEDGGGWQEEHERAARVSRALAALPAVQREAVVFFELDGLSVEEIAAIQKVSESAVKSRLARGRARLRRTYERWGFGGGREFSPGGMELPLAAPALVDVPREKRHD